MENSSKPDLINGIKNATQTAIDWYNAIPAEEFFTRQGEAWSASDNVDHLIRAFTPLTRAIKLPKLGLQITFGKVEHTPKTYAQIGKAYEEIMATGVGAAGTFLPDQQTPEDKAQQKATLLDKLSKAGNALAATLEEKWQDSALDEYQLPHPLLGKLTVREMMLFSIYHTLRHARPEGD